MDATGIILSGAKYAALICIPYVSCHRNNVAIRTSTDLQKCFLLACYQLFFHPLSKYPGPLAAKLSDAYSGFYAICMRLHLATDRDLKHYGKPAMPDTAWFGGPGTDCKRSGDAAWSEQAGIQLG